MNKLAQSVYLIWEKVGRQASMTPAGATGDQTINAREGSVNLAAGQSSLTVTNQLVSESSVIIAVPQTLDGTLTSVRAVPGAGSFTITGNANATNETRVGFMVIG